MAVGASFWEHVIPSEPRSDWLTRVKANAEVAECRRVRAEYDTGSITEAEAYSLCALANHLQARVVVEVGTFIGNSTMALAMGSAVEHIYTCDASNDCLLSTEVIHVYPKRSSTDMLKDLRLVGVQADLCFFDGTLRPVDADLLKAITHKGTVFAFHDFNFGPKVRVRNGKTFHEIVPRKGIGNVDLLKPRLWKHVLVQPQPDTTLALLVPEDRL